VATPLYFLIFFSKQIFIFYLFIFLLDFFLILDFFLVLTFYNRILLFGCLKKNGEKKKKKKKHPVDENRLEFGNFKFGMLVSLH
jgi:hypothetical protein